MNWDERGFTLIESLIVLSIFLIISSITVFTVKPQFEMTNREMFFTQLRADLLYGQQYAISHQEEVNVVFSTENHYYYLRTSFNVSTIVFRYFSKDIYVYPGSLPLLFKFSPSGTVNKFGSLIIQCGDKKYRLTLLIGKGRFYVIEE